MKGKILLIGLILLSFFTVIIIITTKEANKINKEKDFDKTLKLINKLRYFNDKDETFDKIQKYYINLDRSTERRKGIEEEFKLYNIKNYERIPAVDGSKLESLSKGEANGYTFTNDYNVPSGPLGCTLSHMIAIKKAHDNGLDCAIIIEDDTKFTFMPYWKKSLSEIIKETPEDFDILLLTHQNWGKKHDQNKIYKRYSNVKKHLIQSSVCYLISKKGIEKVNNLFFSKNNINFKKEYQMKNSIIDEGVWDSLNVYYTCPHMFPLDSLKYPTTIHGGGIPECNYKPVEEATKYYEPLFWDKLLKKTS